MDISVIWMKLDGRNSNTFYRTNAYAHTHINTFYNSTNGYTWNQMVFKETQKSENSPS